MESAQWLISTGINIHEEIQLEDDLNRLRATLSNARFLINRGEWGRFRDKELAQLLLHLKDAAYDAEDILREHEDQLLRRKVEGPGRSRAGQFLLSSLIIAKSFFNRTKTRVKETKAKLDEFVASTEKVLNLMGLNVEPVKLMPDTSSLIGAPQVFGRRAELDLVIEMLGVIGREDKRDQVIQQMGISAGSVKKRGSRTTNWTTPAPKGKQLKRSTSNAAHIQTCINVSVLPIVGIGGVGKTTLAQLIYNDPRVKAHFDERIWVCVSDLFDKRRITWEIFRSFSGRSFDSSCTFNALQEALNKELLKDSKFLLVLDDIWPNANDQLEPFFAPFKQKTEGSMIIVTTRSPIVAERIITSNCKPIELEGLPNDVYWEFFRICAFGKERSESYPRLQDIGRSISSRLCGSPLAAKTLGRLLSMELTEQHWRAIQNSKLWELPQRENEILPALQLSYLYLPQELKKCFAFCSIFPKDYSFERDEIISLWVAEGFVTPGESMCPEVMGAIYLDDLRSRFLFQADPKFTGNTRYVMHDLIHDMAQSVSVEECFFLNGMKGSFFMQDLSYPNQIIMPHTVRHVSIEGFSGESLKTMGDSQHLNKLRSLRLVTRLDAEMTWFHRLSNIMFLSLKGCNLIKLPESIYKLSSLRYLDISYSDVKELHEKLWCLYSLQVLDARGCSYLRFIPDITKPTNLRYLKLPQQASDALSKIRGLRNLSCLQDLSDLDFWVGRENGRRIGELKPMNQLSGTLTIRSLQNVQSTEEAADARLFDKQCLQKLVLHWEDRSLLWQPSSGDNDVIEGLRPHSSIKCLKIFEFGGSWFSPCWFRPEDLPTLSSLVLQRCLHMKSLLIPILSNLEELKLSEVGIESLKCLPVGIQNGATGDGRVQQANTSSSMNGINGIASWGLRSLTTLHIIKCPKLTNLDEFLSPENLPSIKSILLRECDDLVSIPSQSFVQFVCLQDLKISACNKLMCPQEMVLPPSLRRLSIADCGELDRSFPACLENLTSLTLLQLLHCDNVRSIPLNMIPSTKCLILSHCRGLSSIGGSHGLSSIQYVDLSKCPKLTEVQQHFKKRELPTEELTELLNFDFLTN